MDNFAYVSEYCQRLKQIYDRLTKVGALVNNHHLVLQFVSDLLELFRDVTTLVRQSNPLSSFLQARSMLTLKESSLAKMQTTTSHTVMHTPPNNALQMATYLFNILPRKALSNQFPTQQLYHYDPSYMHLRVFGCLIYPMFPSPTIDKLQPRLTSCVCLGYPLNH